LYKIIDNFSWGRAYESFSPAEGKDSVRTGVNAASACLPRRGRQLSDIRRPATDSDLIILDFSVQIQQVRKTDTWMDFVLRPGRKEEQQDD